MASTEKLEILTAMLLMKECYHPTRLINVLIAVDEYAETPAISRLLMNEVIKSGLNQGFWEK